MLRKTTLQYRLTIPQRMSAGGPLIVALHGYGQRVTSDKATLADRTFSLTGIDWNFCRMSALDELAEQQQVAILYPEAPHRWKGWDLDVPIKNKDLAAVRDLIWRVVYEHRFNRQRIYLAGFSRGAALGALLALTNPTMGAAFLCHSVGPFPDAIECIAHVEPRFPVMVTNGSKEMGPLQKFSTKMAEFFTARHHLMRRRQTPGMKHTWDAGANQLFWDWLNRPAA